MKSPRVDVSPRINGSGDEAVEEVVKVPTVFLSSATYQINEIGSALFGKLFFAEIRAVQSPPLVPRGNFTNDVSSVNGKSWIS